MPVIIFVLFLTFPCVTIIFSSPGINFFMSRLYYYASLGFDINRKWDAKTLHNEISRLLPGYMEGPYFEIVKNSGGTLIRPNLPEEKTLMLSFYSNQLPRQDGYILDC